MKTYKRLNDLASRFDQYDVLVRVMMAIENSHYAFLSPVTQWVVTAMYKTNGVRAIWALDPYKVVASMLENGADAMQIASWYAKYMKEFFGADIIAEAEALLEQAVTLGMIVCR